MREHCAPAIDLDDPDSFWSQIFREMYANKIEGFRIFLSPTRGVYVLRQHIPGQRKQERTLPTARVAELTHFKVNPYDWSNCAMRMRARGLVFSMHVDWKSDWRDLSLPVKPLRTLTPSSCWLAEWMKKMDQAYGLRGFDTPQARSPSNASDLQTPKSVGESPRVGGVVTPLAKETRAPMT